MRECVFQRGSAVALPRVGGIEQLLLCGDRRLHAQLVVMLGKPSLDGHRGEEQRDQRAGNFYDAANGSHSEGTTATREQRCGLIPAGPDVRTLAEAANPPMGHSNGVR